MSLNDLFYSKTSSLLIITSAILLVGGCASILILGAVGNEEILALNPQTLSSWLPFYELALGMSLMIMGLVCGLISETRERG